MRTIRLSSQVRGLGVLLLAAPVSACSNGGADRDAATGSADAPVGTSGNETDRPMALTGCLQQGDGDGDFILTQVNEQPGPVATSGERDNSERDNAAVQKEQRAAAARSYRLSGGPDNLRDLVGHQVRLTGTVEDRGDVQERDRDDEIKEGDLASLDVTAAESVATVCGSATSRSGGERPRRGSTKTRKHGDTETTETTETTRRLRRRGDTETTETRREE